MGAVYGKKKSYSIDHASPEKQQCVTNGTQSNGKASAFADLHRSDGVLRKPPPVSSYVSQPEYPEGHEDDDLIKPKKLVNPVKASKSHQELHRELLTSCKRQRLAPLWRPPPRTLGKSEKLFSSFRKKLDGDQTHRGGDSVEVKPELHRVLESRKRDQLIKQRKQEEEARRKISPLEAELQKRHRKLEELEKQQEQQREENLKAPEFIKVKEKLRRTSVHSKEKEV